SYPVQITTLTVTIPFHLRTRCLPRPAGQPGIRGVGRIQVMLYQGGAQFERPVGWLESVANFIDLGLTDSINANIQGELDGKIAPSATDVTFVADHPTCSSLGVSIGARGADDLVVYDT